MWNVWRLSVTCNNSRVPNSNSPNTYRKEPKIPLLGRAATAFTSIWWLEWCVFHKANLLIKKVLTENSLQLRSCLSRFSRIKLKVDLLRKYFRTLQTGQLPPAYSLSSSSLHFNNSESWSFLTFSSHPWGGRTLVGWLVSRQNGSWASTDRDTWYMIQRQRVYVGARYVWWHQPPRQGPCSWIIIDHKTHRGQILHFNSIFKFSLHVFQYLNIFIYIFSR